MDLNNIELIYILGEPEYNNLDEPTPLTNRPEVLKGLTITFLVCNGRARNHHGPCSGRRQANSCPFDRPCHGFLFASDFSCAYA